MSDVRLRIWKCSIYLNYIDFHLMKSQPCIYARVHYEYKVIFTFLNNLTPYFGLKYSFTIHAMPNGKINDIFQLEIDCFYGRTKSSDWPLLNTWILYLLPCTQECENQLHELHSWQTDLYCCCSVVQFDLEKVNINVMWTTCFPNL